MDYVIFSEKNHKDIIINEGLFNIVSKITDDALCLYLDSKMFEQLLEDLKRSKIDNFYNINLRNEEWKIIIFNDIMQEFSVYGSEGKKYSKVKETILKYVNIAKTNRIPIITEKYVQSFIYNISFYKTLDELLEYMEDDYQFNVMEPISNKYVEWTAPKWTKSGDIVLFMHAKTANATISRLKSEYYKNKSKYSFDEQNYIEYGLNKGKEIYKKYGGKIYAIGQVIGSSKIFMNDNDSNTHWKSNIYAPIANITKLKNPIDISEFNEFITVSRQSSITGIFGDCFEMLKNLIIEKNNNLPKYFLNAKSTEYPLRDVNEHNWINISGTYRRQFFLEIQFRTYFVNYLLKQLSNIKTIYSECRCLRKNSAFHYFHYIDNVILFNKKYLPVEVKININNEKDINKQVYEYCNLEKLYLLHNDENNIINKKSVYTNNVVIIDTEKIYIYYCDNNLIKEVYSLDNLKEVEDIDVLKKILEDNLN